MKFRRNNFVIIVALTPNKYFDIGIFACPDIRKPKEETIGEEINYRPFFF